MFAIMSLINIKNKSGPKTAMWQAKSDRDRIRWFAVNTAWVLWLLNFFIRWPLSTSTILYFRMYTNTIIRTVTDWFLRVSTSVKKLIIFIYLFQLFFFCLQFSFFFFFFSMLNMATVVPDSAVVGENLVPRCHRCSTPFFKGIVRHSY